MLTLRLFISPHHFLRRPSGQKKARQRTSFMSSFFVVKFLFSFCVTTHVIRMDSVVFKKSFFDSKLLLLSCVVLTAFPTHEFGNALTVLTPLRLSSLSIIMLVSKLDSRLCSTTSWVCSGLSDRICSYGKEILQLRWIDPCQKNISDITTAML